MVSRVRVREIRREIIRPRSPTPQHRRNLPLSFLDQLSPPFHIHIILYFQPSPFIHSPQTPLNLKRSFSDALAVYYPLAGRLRDDNSSVDCNDAGAEYVEAQFPDLRIMHVVQNPQIDDLKLFVPITPSAGRDVPLAVQVSFFGCAGVSIGVCMSHRVADAMSMAMFINTWAAFHRGDYSIAKPTFNLASRFIPADFSTFITAVGSPPPDKIVTRVFKFDGGKIDAVKKAASGPLIENPTKVEAVTAFIWRHLIEATSSRDKKRVFAATHAVDIRSRGDPPLPHHYFGNACARAMATAEESCDEKLDYYSLAMKLRNTIRKADGDYVRRLENGEEFLKYYSKNEENDPEYKDGRKSLELCGFTSWSRIPAYEGGDYGWGKPAWVSVVGVEQKNFVCLMGTKCGNGIEAWVNMAEEDIALIEAAFNLLHHQTTHLN